MYQNGAENKSLGRFGVDCGLTIKMFFTIHVRSTWPRDVWDDHKKRYFYDLHDSIQLIEKKIYSN